MRDVIAAVVYGVTLGAAPVASSVAERETTKADLFEAMDIAAMPRYDYEHGKHTHWKRCKSAQVPGDTGIDRCHRRLRELASAFVDAGDEYGIDPWILAAVAWKETRWNTWAQGGISEAGVMQLAGKAKRHPDGKLLTFYADPKACRRVPDECQREVVFRAAGIIAKRRDQCGSLEGGLFFFNNGHACTHKNGYGPKVLDIAKRLRALVETAAYA